MLFDNSHNKKDFLKIVALGGKEIYLSLENFKSFSSSIKFVNPSKFFYKTLLHSSIIFYPFIKYIYNKKFSLNENGKDLINQAVKIFNSTKNKNYKTIVAISNFTNGIERYIFKVKKNDKNFSILKISQSNIPLKRELKFLKEFEKLISPNIITPRISNYGKHKDYYYLTTKEIRGNFKTPPLRINKTIFQTVLQLNRHFIDYKKSNKTELLKSLKNKALFLLKYNYITSKEYKQINFILSNLIRKEFPLVFSHGDFTPFNIKLLDSSAVIFDFEYAVKKQLPAFDIFHYIFQASFIIRSEQITALNLKKIFAKNIRWIEDYFNKMQVSQNLKQDFFTCYFLYYSYKSIKENWDKKAFDNFIKALKISLKFNFFENDKSFNFALLSFDKISLKKTLELFESAISNNKKISVNELNVNSLQNVFLDFSRFEAYNSSNLRLADGMPIVFLSKLFKSPLPERISGPDLIEKIFELSSKNNYTIFLLGSNDKNLTEIQTRAQKKFGKINFVGAYSPSYSNNFTKEENIFIINYINKTKPNFLLISLSSPKQEKWIHENIDKVQSNVLIGLGAAFDIFAGVFPRAPLFIQKIGFEWLWRLLCEPKRLFKRYFIGIFVLLYLTIIETYLHFKK